MEKKKIKEAIEYNDSRFTKRIIFNAGGNSVFVLNFNPSQELPTHTHPGSELFLKVIQGQGTLIINGQETEISIQDIVHVSGDEEFAFRNSSNEPVSLYVTLCKIPSKQYTQNI
jgi:mannose-6-phosphate isomerase-like protein (cupin superfamily)